MSGLPLLKPPYGSITAIDLNKGEIVWQIAHGETPDNIRNHPALKGLNIPRTGRPGILGTLTTKTLVISGEAGFFTTPSGARGAMLRAYDKATGKETGAVYIPAPQSGSPMTYMLNGQQYLIVSIGGANYSGELVAFRLPAANGRTPAAAPAISGAAASLRPSRSVLDGVYTTAQAQRGESLYKQNCAVCHGAALEGIEMGPALAGGEFLDKWNGQSLGDLFERIRTTMPRDKPGRLSTDVNIDITAYLLSVNGYPAGRTPLPGDAQVLKQIQVSAKK